MLFFHNVSTRRDLLPQVSVPPTTRLFNRLIACPLIVRQTESDMITIYFLHNAYLFLHYYGIHDLPRDLHSNPVL